VATDGRAIATDIGAIYAIGNCRRACRTGTAPGYPNKKRQENNAVRIATGSGIFGDGYLERDALKFWFNAAQPLRAGAGPMR